MERFEQAEQGAEPLPRLATNLSFWRRENPQLDRYLGRGALENCRPSSGRLSGKVSKH